MKEIRAEIKNKWVGSIDVRPLDGSKTLAKDRVAAAIVIGWGQTRDEFENQVSRALNELGLALIKLSDVVTLESHLSSYHVGTEFREAVEQVSESHPIVFLTFYSCSLDEMDAEDTAIRWTALTKVLQREGVDTLGENQGAYVTVIGLSEDVTELEELVSGTLDHLGLVLIEMTEVETCESRLSTSEVGPEFREAMEQVSQSNPIILLTFHCFPLDAEDAVEEWSKKLN